MSVLIKDAYKIVDDRNYPIECLNIDFSKAGSTIVYIQNVKSGLLHNIVYKTSNPKITVDGPKNLASWHKAPLMISWEPCDEKELFIDVSSKVR